MTDQHSPAVDQSQQRSALARELSTMPRWKHKLLALSLAIGIIGAGGEVATSVLKNRAPPTTSPQAVPSASNTAPPPVGSSGFVSGQPTLNSSPQSSTNSAPAANNPTLTDRVTPWMRRVGLSFFVGI